MAFAIPFLGHAPAEEAPPSDALEDPSLEEYHLEPIAPYDPDGYNQEVLQTLIGDSLGELWMVAKPSFNPEYAVIIRHERDAENIVDYMEKRFTVDRWLLQFRKVERQIWANRGKPATTTDFQVEIDVAFASRIKDVWAKVLEETKYEGAVGPTIDGVCYQFYCGPALFGEVWTPPGGIPRRLADLGDKLGELARSPADQRRALTEQILKLVADLQHRIEKPEQGAADRPSPAALLRDPESGSE